MSTIDAIATSTHAPLSVKAACFGFVASTALMIAVMMLVGNLGS